MRAFVAQNRFLIAFSLLSSVMGISVGIAKVTTSLYAVHLGASEAMLGLLAGSQSIGVLAMSIPLGFLVERHGPRKLFVFGTIVAGCLYVLMPLVPSAGFLLVCTAITGCFMPFRFVSLNTVFLEQLLRMGESKAGWNRGTHMAGNFLIGPMLAATAVALLDYRGTYWLIAALFALTIAMSSIVFGQVERTQLSARTVSFEEVRDQLALVFRDPDLRGACFAEFTTQAITQFYSFFIVVIALAELGFDATRASGLVSAQGLAYVFALFSLGGVTRTLGQLNSYLTSAGIVSLALTVLGTAQSGAALLVGGVLLGLGAGLLQIVNLMRFARIGARLGRGRIAGLNALVGPAGGMIGNLGGGLVGERIGLRTVFLLFIPLLLVLGRQLLVSERQIVAEAGS